MTLDSLDKKFFLWSIFVVTVLGENATKVPPRSLELTALCPLGGLLRHSWDVLLLVSVLWSSPAVSWGVLRYLAGFVLWKQCPGALGGTGKRF